MECHAIRFAVTVSLCVVVAGCGQGRKFKTVSVSGKITFGGAPVEGANVVFNPPAKVGEVPHPAAGTTDAQGNYKLSTFESVTKPVEGAIPGTYTVTVTKVAAGMTKPANVDMSKIENMSEEEKAKMFSGMKATDTSKGAGVRSGGATSDKMMPADYVKTDLPSKYANTNDSGLTAEVKDGGPQTFDFDLKEE